MFSAPVMHLRKEVDYFGKKVVSVLVRESQKTNGCVTDGHDTN